MTNTVSIQDLYLAVFLFMNNVTLQGHTRSHGYSSFYFEENEDTQNLIDQFMQHDNPFMKFASSLRQLKSIMYADNFRPESSNSTNHVKQNTGTTVL